jgi:hypothetical protein
MSRGFGFTGAIMLTASLLVVVAVNAGQRVQSGTPAAIPVQPMKPAPAGPLPPIPFQGPLARPRPVVQAVYEFAARHPEVLQYMPCYCGCDRAGHRGNHDCFVRSRDANGRVTWDAHGAECTICVDVARDAMLMFNSGASVTQIRAAIDQKWGSRFPSHTPTPLPPKPAPKSS